MIYSLKALLICIVTPPSALLILLLAPFDRNGRLAYAVGRLWASMILKIAGVRVQVRGLDRLDPARPYIFIANHQSNVDIPALIKSLPGFQLRWIAKKQLAYIPFFGWALWASRHILVDRSNRAGAMASLRQSKERLAAGISVVIFPEGTRGADAELLPFKRGGFFHDQRQPVHFAARGLAAPGRRDRGGRRRADRGGRERRERPGGARAPNYRIQRARRRAGRKCRRRRSRGGIFGAGIKNYGTG